MDGSPVERLSFPFLIYSILNGDIVLFLRIAHFYGIIYNESGNLESENEEKKRDVISLNFEILQL